jgi:DNA-binding SARP family transcriptional activator
VTDVTRRSGRDWGALTVVHGPPGSGKTRFVLDALDAHRDVYVGLGDLYHPSELPVVLVNRLRARVPNLSPILSAAVGPASGPISDADPTGRADQLGSHIGGAILDALGDGPPHRLVLALDGVEHVAADPSAARLVESLVRNAPASLSIVLTTRSSLPFPVARLVAEHDVRVVEMPAHQSGTVDSILAGRPIDADLADRLARIASGRPGVAELLLAAIECQPSGDRTTSLQAWEADGDVVAGAARHLIDGLDSRTARALSMIAGLGAVDAHELRRLDVDDAPAVLDTLARSHLVERAESGARVRLNHLVADAVGERLPALDADAVAAMIALIAARGDAGGALRLACLHGGETLATELRRYGVAAIEDGHAQLVLDAIEQAHDSTDLHGLAGRAAHARGDGRRAIAEYQLAAEHELRPGDAWRHGLLEYFQGQHERALAIYDKGLAAARPDDDPGDLALLAGFAGSAAWVTGSIEIAREHAARALTGATAAGNEAALAVAYTLAALVAASDGDRMANDWNYVRALQHAERSGDLMQIARIRSNRGSRLLEEGEYDLALAELDGAVRHAELGGYGIVLALALTNRAEVLTRLGRLDEARTDLAGAVDQLQQHGSLLVAYPLTVLARLYLLRGDIEQARGAAERALRIAEPAHDQQITVAAKVQLARALAESDPETARRLIDEASESETSLDAAEVWSSKSALLLAAGDRNGAQEAAGRSAAIARTRRDRFALASALEVTALAEVGADAARRRFDEARALFDELGCVLDAARVEIRVAAATIGAAGAIDPVSAARLGSIIDTTRRRGARALAAEAEAVQRGLSAAPPATLMVNLLGNFALSVDGVQIPAAAWQSKKARDLFKMLAVLDGRPLPREQAIDRLWGDEPTASSKLSVALATARAVLDPAKRFAADYFIVADGESIRCSPGTIDSDLRRFHALANAALSEHRSTPGTRATELLASAEAAYSGDVLESDPYAEWYVSTRESARAKYLAVAQALATVRRNGGASDDAIRLWLRVLEHEPYDEPAHLALVEALAGVGRHGDARRRYQHYVERMRELDIEPRAFPTAPRA